MISHHRELVGWLRTTGAAACPRSSRREVRRRVRVDAGKPSRDWAVSDHVIEFRAKPVASIKNAFQAACRRAGIEDCTPHTIRHTAASHMVERGVPLAQVARMLGDSEAMVERVYGKHSPDYLRCAADALAGDPGPRERGKERRDV